MNNKRKIRIIFIQPGFAHYRGPLFKILAERHSIHFVFERSIEKYPGITKPVGISFSFLDRGFGTKWIHLIYYLLKYRPDIVVSSSSSSARSMISFIYAFIYKKRFILWILEWRKRKPPTHPFRHIWTILKNLVGKKIILYSHAVIVGGSAAKNYALTLGKEESAIFMAMQCTEDLNSKLSHIYPNAKKKNKKYTFLYMSRIIRWKGLDILLNAYFELRKKRNDVRLLIGGDGPFKRHCKNIVKTYNIRDVEFIGSVDHNKVAKIYKQADVFVLPTYFCGFMYESWGLVINEAMSMSLPVITTTAVGAAFDLIINKNNGFIVKENDTQKLHKAMEQIIGMNLDKMGENSRHIFEKKNDFCRMANGFSSAIEYVLK